MEILEILRCLAFVSTRFGYSAFQEYNFVYLSSIDILASNPNQTMTFIQRHIPPPPSGPHTPFPARISHPAVKADILFFLDTLEYFVPILPRQEIPSLVPIVQDFLSPEESRDKKHLESAHSVYLAILARGDISLPHEIYIQTIYSVPSHRKTCLIVSILCSLSCVLIVVFSTGPVRTTSPSRFQYVNKTLPFQCLE